MIDVFSMLLHLHNTIKKLKIILKEYQNIKLFPNLYSWIGIEYPTSINKNNYALFETNNSEIALIVLYVDVEVMISQFEVGECAKIYKSIKQSYLAKQDF